MMRVIVLATVSSLLVVGCRRTFVVVEELEGQSDSNGETSSGGEELGSGEGDTSIADTSGGGDSDGSSSGAMVDCDIPSGHMVCDDEDDPVRILGLDCPGSEFDSIPIVDSTFSSPDGAAWRRVRQYGNAFWEATEGNAMLVMSTGVLPEPDSSRFLEIEVGQTWAEEGGNGNPDGAALPEPVSVASGSAGGAGGMPFMDCDGEGDCSESLPGLWSGTANDLLWLRFEIDVPAGAAGFRADVAVFSAEYPERVGAPANDAFVWWLESNAFTGNLATYDGRPMTVTGLRTLMEDPERNGNAPALARTGFEGVEGTDCELDGKVISPCPQGATSGWLTITGPTEPGETATIVLALFDQGDDDLDTVVVVDNWRWYCRGCDVGATCGAR